MTGSPQLNINIEANSKDLNIKPQIYVRVLQKAVLQTSQDILALETALPVDDYDQVKAIAHKFKGDYDNLRITDMSSLARQIEDIAKNSRDKEKIAGLTQNFIGYFDQLKKIVEAQPS